MRKLCLLTAAVIAGSGAFAQTVPAPVTAPQTAAEISRLSASEPYSLPWQPIQEQNILWKKRVWRNADIKHPVNHKLSNSADIPGANRLINVLIEGAFAGAYKIYSAADERFTTALGKQDLIALLSSVQGGKAGFNPDRVAGFRIKEDWLYLKAEKKIVVRTIGIAPLYETTNADGSVAQQPAFWVYYPETRNYLSRQMVYGTKESWDQYFEGRNYHSNIDIADHH